MDGTLDYMDRLLKEIFKKETAKEDVKDEQARLDKYASFVVYHVENGGEIICTSDLSDIKEMVDKTEKVKVDFAMCERMAKLDLISREDGELLEGIFDVKELASGMGMLSTIGIDPYIYEVKRVNKENLSKFYSSVRKVARDNADVASSKAKIISLP